MRSKSAGGLKVKALGMTPRDLGSSPSQCSNFSCSKFASRENYLFINSYKANENHIRKMEIVHPMHMHIYSIRGWCTCASHNTKHVVHMCKCQGHRSDK